MLIPPLPQGIFAERGIEACSVFGKSHLPLQRDPSFLVVPLAHISVETTHHLNEDLAQWFFKPTVEGILAILLIRLSISVMTR
jgi:hypothetical protein